MKTYLLEQTQVILVIVVHKIHHSITSGATVILAVFSYPVQPCIPLLHASLSRSFSHLRRECVEMDMFTLQRLSSLETSSDFSLASSMTIHKKLGTCMMVWHNDIKSSF